MSNRGADYEVQVSIVSVLVANAGLQSLLGNPVRVYQDVPTNPQFPYLYVGDSQVLPDRFECIDGKEIFVDIHAYSTDKGFSEVKRICAVIADLLNDANLTVVEHNCVDIYLSNERTFKDSPSLTKHGVLTFRVRVEPTV